MTTSKRQFLNVPYGAYYNEPIPQENVDLTHVERGSRSGKLLRPLLAAHRHVVPR